ncbi:MAG: class B sortase, partial [Propionibacteriaceae bacterium]|nr:class B sortase [Propionibacteriaceae bacterium]
IYGHNLKDGAMFAQLERFKAAEFFARHDRAWLYRPGQTLSLTIVAVAVVEPDSPLYDPVAAGPSALSEYLATLEAAAQHWRDLPFDPARDRLITWSTCSYEHKDARTVVTAKVTSID